MKKLEENYADELEGEDRDEEVVSPVMVGLIDQFNDLKERLIVQGRTKLKLLSLIGMQGIGKTSLSRKVFDDPHIVEYFEYRVWVKIGRQCRLNEVASNILAQLSRDGVCVEENDDGVWCLNESLRGKRYLIVLDDVWDKYMAAYLQIPVYSRRRNELKNHFPDEENGSRVLLISRLQQADEFNLRISGEMMEMRLMNKEESWDLLREKVFGELLNAICRVSHLPLLRSLKCVVVNPKASPSFVPLSSLPWWLTKLSLSGSGYAWEEMSILEFVPHLTVLKLRSYACQGPRLQTLVIEDTDLVRWKVGGGSFYVLDCLLLKS